MAGFQFLDAFRIGLIRAGAPDFGLRLGFGFARGEGEGEGEGGEVCCDRAEGGEAGGDDADVVFDAGPDGGWGVDVWMIQGRGLVVCLFFGGGGEKTKTGAYSWRLRGRVSFAGRGRC